MDEIENPISDPIANSLPPIVPTAPVKSSSGPVMKIVVGVVILAIVGIGTALGAQVWDPLWNPFRPSPEKVIEKVADKMGDIKSFHSEMKAAMSATGDEIVQVLVNFSGDSDIADSQNLKTATNFDFQIIQERTGESLSLAGDIKAIKDVSYFKLSKLDFPPELGIYLTLFGIDRSKLIGQWIKIDTKEIENLEGTNYSKLPKEQQEKIKEKIEKLFKEKKTYSVKKEMADEKINGKKAYHYILSLDRENIKEAILELFNISMDASGKNTAEDSGISSSFMAGGIAQSVDKLLEKIGGIDIEIWIGKKDNLLYGAKIDKEIDMSVLGGETKGKLAINFDIGLSNFNEPINIETPEKFIELKDILPQTPLMPSRMPETYQTPGGAFFTTPSGYPYQQPIIQNNNSLFMASVLEILSDLVKR